MRNIILHRPEREREREMKSTERYEEQDKRKTGRQKESERASKKSNEKEVGKPPPFYDRTNGRFLYPSSWHSFIYAHLFFFYF